MKEITIDIEHFKTKNLPFTEYCILQLVWEGHSSQDIEDIFPGKLQELEKRDLIKILPDSIEMRKDGLDIFSYPKYESNVIDILNHLNTVTGSKYRNTEGNKKFIRARLKEGYPVSEIKKTVEFMTMKWRGSKMEEYLRPETLFNATKFPGYHNQANKTITLLTDFVE